MQRFKNRKIATTWSAFVLSKGCIPMKSSCITKQTSTHWKQITGCSLLETSAVSSEMIVKTVAFCMFADICPIMPRAIASSRSFWISGDVHVSSLFRSHSMISEPVVSAADENWSSPQTLFQCSSLLLMAKPVALSIGCWTGLRAKSFFSCAFLMHVVQITHYRCECRDISCSCLLMQIRWFVLLKSFLLSIAFSS